MSIDWTLFARYAGPIVAGFAGFLINRAFERRPNLLCYVAHSGAVVLYPDQSQAGEPEGQTEPAQPTIVHVHAYVISNSGGKAATNVVVGHRNLPAFNVFPPRPYEVNQLQNGGVDIVFKTIVPKEQLTITYLYSPPLTYNMVNTTVKSDEGFARLTTVLPASPYPAWVSLILALLILIGATTVLYAIGSFLFG